MSQASLTTRSVRRKLSRHLSEDNTSAQPKYLQRSCPLCGRDNHHEPISRYSQGPWTVRQCVDCGMVYLENVLPYEELVKNHAWTSSRQFQRQARRQHEPVFSAVSQRWRRLSALWNRTMQRDKCIALIKQYVQRGRLLDVGCGGGGILRKLNAEFIPCGIEVDAEAARAADLYAARCSGRVIQADALSGLRGLEASSFDGVVMRSFLEHENQPAAVLVQAARVLRPGGWLILKMPNYGSVNRILRGRRWCGFRFPDHVNYFTAATLRSMVTQAGLVTARCRLSDRLPTSDSLWLVAQRRSQ